MNRNELAIRKAIMASIEGLEYLCDCTVDTSGFLDDNMITITFPVSDKDESDVTIQLDAQVY